MTGPKRMRPESAEADPELTVSYVVEPERRMSELSVDRPQSAVTTGRRSARGNWHNRLRIGIMGGTFDPIHNGHLVAASEVSWVYDLDEVIFVPTGRPVFKLDILDGGRTNATCFHAEIAAAGGWPTYVGDFYAEFYYTFTGSFM